MNRKFNSLFPRVSSLFFEGKYTLCLFVVLIFSLVDGTMTLILLKMGAREANPLMRYALTVSHEFFFLLKYFLTAGGLLFLLANGKQRIFGGKLSLEEIAAGLVIFYEGLVIYEITIFHVFK